MKSASLGQPALKQAELLGDYLDKTEAVRLDERERRVRLMVLAPWTEIVSKPTQRTKTYD